MKDLKDRTDSTLERRGYGFRGGARRPRGLPNPGSARTGLMTWPRGFLVFAAALAAACADGPVEPPPTPASITISPSATTFSALGQTVGLTATVHDQHGTVMADARIEWSSSDASVATVDGAGLVAAAGNGNAMITAASGGVTASAAITVAQAVAAVRVSPDSVTLRALGDTVRLPAEAVDANGHPILGASFEWSSSDASVAAVDGTGLVTAVGNGEASVAAGSGSVTASAAIKVEQAVAAVRVSPDSVTLRAFGDTVRLAVAAVDANGHPILGATFAWSSSDASVASVDGTGLVTTAGDGEATITAVSGGVTASAAVMVEQAVAAVRVSPDSVMLRALGDTVWLAAEAVDANGHPILGASFAWSSSDASVAAVDGAGLVTAVGNGEVTITAAAGGVTASASVTVDQVVAEVRVTPDSATLWILGDTVRLAAAAVDSNGHPIPGASFAWSSSDGSVATVDRTGLVTAVTEGSAEITAEAVGWAVVGSGRLLVRLLTDREALVALYDATSGPYWRQSDNWLTDAPLASWYGVTTGAGGRVTELNLKDNGLAGQMPPQLGSLVRLNLLDLSTSGPLFCETASGTVSTTHTVAVRPATSRGYADSGRDPRGSWTVTPPVPADTVFVDRMELRTPRSPSAQLSTTGNRLTGPIPSELGNLRDLRALFLVGNQLTGPIPPELGELRRLRHMDLGVNQLTGPIPPQLGKLAELVHLELACNELTGDIPRELGQLEQLSRLSLNLNRLTGRIPPEIGNLSRLTDLYIQHNLLTGNIPPALGNLSNLQYLWLGDNKLSGPIPPELGNLASLRSLLLLDNQLTGALPRELGNLGSLKTLWLQHNELTGRIPRELGDLPRLRKLMLFRNRLSGPIPAALGNIGSLESIWLQGNELEGSIPPELGNLTQLRDLELYENRLSGPIPPALGKLRSLEWLTLQNNGLSGAIPPELGRLGSLGFLYLSENRLSDPIPHELGNLGSLKYLTLDHNRLTGAIPPRLGLLSRLVYLYLDGNDLEGAIPAELGDLHNLEALAVHNNAGLSGPLPRDLARLQLFWFSWSGTNLCAPREPNFQAWLATIKSNYGNKVCRIAPREALQALYAAAGGPGWRIQTNWLTQEPLSAWYGVTASGDSLTALDLSGNGLAGAIPAEVGDLADLRLLDLSGNELTGALPSEFGNLADLQELELSQNRLTGRVPRRLADLQHLQRLGLAHNRLEGAIPGTWTSLSLEDFRWNDSGLCAPDARWVRTWLEGIADHVPGENCTSPLLLSVPSISLMQATQDSAGTVPLIAGRETLVRVFAAADRANEYRPRARVTLFRNGREVHRAEVPMVDRQRGLPEVPDPRELDDAFRVPIAGALAVPGVEVVIEVDPDSVIPRAGGSQVRVPAEGRLPLAIRKMPPMELTLVPVLVESDPDDGVRDWTSAIAASGTGHPAVTYMSTVLPVGELVLTVREPLLVSYTPSRISDWVGLLQAVELIRATENGRGYYSAVTAEQGSSLLGIAYLGEAGAPPVSASIPDSAVLAHELGHNMSLRHAPCGGPFGVDSDYPYRDGSIGAWGYDFRSGEMVDPSTNDLMSYCEPQWVSAYNFKKALEFRLEVEAAQAPSRAGFDARRTRNLLVWGSRSADGRLQLDPAFVLDAPTKMPSRTGPYRVEGLDATGASMFALDFEMDELSEGGGSFLFMIPFEEARLDLLDRIVLSGPEGEATLDHDTDTPMAIVIDRTTGRIRSILRGEAAAARAAAMNAGVAVVDSGTEVLISYGLPARGSN